MIVSSRPDEPQVEDRVTPAGSSVVPPTLEGPPPPWPSLSQDPESAYRPPMGLARRLALLTAIMSVLLVLGATEISLRLSERSRLEDLREESVTLANTLAAFVNRVAPKGNPDGLAVSLSGWPHHHIAETHAWIFVERDGHLSQAAASDSLAPLAPSSFEYEALTARGTVVRLSEGPDPGWAVSLPVGVPVPFGVLTVKVDTGRLEDWARLERRRAYALALASALLVSLGVALLTSQWVSRPLSSLGSTMARAHGGARGAPAAPEVGPTEFRSLARRYNLLREALATRERESEARASLRTLEERAHSYDRLALLEETATAFAHEIGTPLNTVSGHLQLLHEDLRRAGDTAGVERVNLLLAQVARVTQIVRTRLARGTWPRPAVRPADVAEVTHRVLRFLEPTLEEARVLAIIEGPGSRPAWARCDPALVEQILLNLLKNAIEALPPGGKITVTVGAQPPHGATVDIADDGPGLADVMKDQLFNPFATTKGPSGTGLGLAVSRRLARVQNGDLIYLPTTRGTRWRLTLPSPEA